MNKAENKRIESAILKMREARDTLEDIVASRSSEFEGRTGRWQDGDSGRTHADRTSYIETAHASLEDAISTLEEMSDA